MKIAELFIIIHVSFAYVAAVEVCVWETVNASCSAGQVISIETALYGRMSNSRCFNMTENETECSVDFRLQLQRQFGGKQNIQFNVVNEIFTKTKTGCGKGPPFLDITHRCIDLLKSETCVSETFNATCRSGTVIFIQRALYGRMRNSRCIRFENTGLDCYANVQLYLERQCNGRSECRIRASDQQLTSAESSCRRQQPYLDVEYTCTHGFSCPPFQPLEGANIFRTSNGYLVTCPNDTNTKDLLCRDGSWSKDPRKICPTNANETDLNLLHIAMFTIPAAVLLVSIFSVMILLHRMQKKAQRKRARAEDDYADYPESHLRRNGATCISEYVEYGEIDDDGGYASYSEVRNTGP